MSIMSNAKRALAIAAAAATLLSMAACGSSNAASGKSDSSGAASSGKIEVVASINQWGSVAEDLGGSNVEVTNIMTKTNDPLAPVHVIGGGLAGSEAAWALANRGVPVVLHEMRPVATTAVASHIWVSTRGSSPVFRVWPRATRRRKPSRLRCSVMRVATSEPRAAHFLSSLLALMMAS